MPKNIIIQNLNSDQSQLVQMVKEMTEEKTSSKAIFKALQEYVELKISIHEKNEKIKQLQLNLLDLI